MAMAETTTFTAFLHFHTHQRLLRFDPHFIHPALSVSQCLRFPCTPLTLHGPCSVRSQHPRFPNLKISCDASNARESDSGSTLNLEQGQSDAVSWLGANVEESSASEEHLVGTYETVGDVTDYPRTEKKKSETDTVRRSRRGRKKKTFDLPDNDAEQTSGSDDRHPIIETTLKSQVFEEEKESDARPPSLEAKPSSNFRTANSNRKSERVEEWKSMIDENKYFKKAAERQKKDGSKDGTYEDLRARIQELISADLDTKLDENSDEEDCPLWVDEEDPNWLDEPDDGWGFRVSELFVEKNKKVQRREGADGADLLDWDLEPEKWSAKEIDVADWSDTVFGDPTPLVVLLFDRYGKKARESYHVLRELEAAANRIWDSHRLPPRLVKINASVEVDLVSALKAKEFPMLLFIRAGKLLHRQTGYYTADELMRIISYFYHGAGRPSCLKNVQSPESIPSD